MLRFIANIYWFITAPRWCLAKWRFNRTGTEFDYWRYEYYDDGPDRMADIIMHKDRLIAYYCEQAYRLRHGLPLDNAAKPVYWPD